MTATVFTPDRTIAPPQVRRPFTHTLSDIIHFSHRGLRHQFRSIDALLLGILLPVIIMLVFVYIFAGALSTGSSGLEYVDFVVPGVILLAAGYGAANTALSVANDMTSGMVDRFRSLPVAGWTVPAGHVVASTVKNLLTTAITIVAAIAVGFRPVAGVSEWLGIIGLVLLYIMAITWLGAAVGMVVTSVESASAFSFFMLFLPYLSNAFVPVETMPDWLQAFAQHQPMTPLADALRALLIDSPVGNQGWIAAAWLVAIIALAMPLSALLFRRRTQR